MYIVLLPTHEWWTFFTKDDAIYFAKQIKIIDSPAKILKCIESKVWEKIDF